MAEYSAIVKNANFTFSVENYKIDLESEYCQKKVIKNAFDPAFAPVDGEHEWLLPDVFEFQRVNRSPFPEPLI